VVEYPLFVYGTLRGGSDNDFARRLQAECEFIATGRLRGSLYRIAHYPGCVEESESANGADAWVTGEIWRPRESQALLEALDNYEGEEYRRVLRSVETAEGPAVCWVYLYAASIEGKQRIISGDWLAE
jgi:gamma-glutamylcyclotransferase (GGCT)/AIG2-like uncharacterized protein YtfP